MQTYQKEQLNNKIKKAEMLDILIIVWSFSSALLNSVLFFFNLQSGSGQLAIVYVLVAVMSSVLCFRYFSRMIPIGFLFAVLMFIIIGFSFVYTRFVYGTSDAMFVSEFKAYFAMVICTVLISMLIAWRKKTDINLKIVFVAIIILTLISFLSLVRSDSLTSGGYIRDSSGMIYQNISYYSAHAFGLTIFHIAETKRIKELTWAYKIMCLIFLVVQASTCFLSGGRGGLVLLVVLFVANILFYMGKKAYKFIIPVLFFVIITRFAIPWLVNQLDINIKGLNRILNFLNGDLFDDGRISLYIQSFSIFSEKPILGNGIGSVFYYLHSYSHNAFLDVLVETGIIGMAFLVVLIFVYIIKTISLFHQGSLFRFMTMIFICGITLNMFSGYVWVNPHIWLPLAVVLTVNKTVDIQRNNNSDDIDVFEIDNTDDSCPLEDENNG